MHHRHDVRPRLVDFGVDEALQEHRSAARIYGVAVEVEFHDVVGRHQRRRQRARHQEMIGIGGMAGADMAKTIQHAEIGENAASGHDVIDQRRIDARNRAGWGIGWGLGSHLSQTE